MGKREANGFKKEQKSSTEDRPSLYQEGEPFRWQILYPNVAYFVYLHVSAFYAAFIMPKQNVGILIGYLYGMVVALGPTVSAHRYFTHRTFKANTKLRLIMIFLHTMTVQNSLSVWVRDHRTHHKYTDTNADPHNSKRGFFFSHIGWLMVKKHPDVKKFGQRIDMTDLDADPMVRFQRKYYYPLAIVIGFLLPTWIFWYFVNETLFNSWHASILMYTIMLHITWSINSFSHMYGAKPFDKNITSTDTCIKFGFGYGEGWHNYHHVFPWDYKTSELPTYRYNVALAFIDFFAWLGWATDLKTVNKEMINQRVARTGDGSHPNSKKPAVTKLDLNCNEEEIVDDEHLVWGWGDNDLTDDDKKCAEILCQTSVR